jgi:hypothetical protein
MYARVAELQRMAIMFDHATSCRIYNQINAQDHGCNCGWESEEERSVAQMRELKEVLEMGRLDG